MADAFQAIDMKAVTRGIAEHALASPKAGKIMLRLCRGYNGKRSNQDEADSKHDGATRSHSAARAALALVFPVFQGKASRIGDLPERAEAAQRGGKADGRGHLCAAAQNALRISRY